MNTDYTNKLYALISTQNSSPWIDTHNINPNVNYAQFDLIYIGMIIYLFAVQINIRSASGSPCGPLLLLYFLIKIKVWLNF